MTQGLGGRSKVDAPTKAWAESRAFLDRSAAAGAPVYSLLMTRPLNGPFTLAGGTTRYEGVPLWNELIKLAGAASNAAQLDRPRAPGASCGTRSTTPTGTRPRARRCRRRSGSRCACRRRARRANQRYVGRTRRHDRRPSRAVTPPT